MVRDVFAWGATLGHGDKTTAEDNAIAILRFEDDRTATIEASWTAKGGIEVRNEIYCERGRIVHDSSATSIRAFLEEPVGYLAEKTDADTGWVYPVAGETRVAGYDEQFRHFVACYRDGSTPRETFEDGYVVNAIIDAAYRAMRSGRWEAVVTDALAGAGRMSAPTATPAPAWIPEAFALLERLVRDPGRGHRDRQPVVRRRDRRRRPGPPVRHRPFADPGRGDVPALRVVPRLQPDRRAVDDVPHPGRRRERPAPGDVHRADPRPRRGDPVELQLRAARHPDGLLGQRPVGRPGRDGARRPARGLRVIAVTSVEQSMSGEIDPVVEARLLDEADLVIDLCTPHADALCAIDGVDTPVGPGSTITAVAIVNSIKVRTAQLLAERGALPPVLTRASVIGAERSRASFVDAYREHARRLARAIDPGGDDGGHHAQEVSEPI